MVIASTQDSIWRHPLSEKCRSVFANSLYDNRKFRRAVSGDIFRDTYSCAVFEDIVHGKCKAFFFFYSNFRRVHKQRKKCWQVWILPEVDCVWNVMAHAHKPDFVFRRNGRVHLNRRGCQLSRLLAAEVCASAVVMLDTPCSEVVWRVLATLCNRQFPLHFPFRAKPCGIAFQLDSTNSVPW